MSERITLVGAGAVGSFTCLALAKMGFENLLVLDFDVIEPENMNCQFYRTRDVGLLKAETTARLIEEFTDTKIDRDTQPYRSEIFPGIVIMSVDNMETRQRIWSAHKHNQDTRMIIDPRMGAESALVYVMNPNNPKDIESYEKTLYSDTKAVQERCTAKSTTYSALMLSGFVAKCVKDIVVGDPYARVTSWSIRENQFLAWPSTQTQTPAPETTRAGYGGFAQAFE